MSVLAKELNIPSSDCGTAQGKPCPQVSRRTCRGILEARAGKSPRDVFVPDLKPFPVLGPGPRWWFERSSNWAKVRCLGSPDHPSAPPAHLLEGWRSLSLPRERTTQTLKATSDISSTVAAPTRPPTNTLQSTATSQRGPETQCVSVEKQLERETVTVLRQVTCSWRGRGHHTGWGPPS